MYAADDNRKVIFDQKPLIVVQGLVPQVDHAVCIVEAVSAIILYDDQIGGNLYAALRRERRGIDPRIGIRVLIFDMDLSIAGIQLHAIDRDARTSHVIGRIVIKTFIGVADIIVVCHLRALQQQFPGRVI